MLREWDKLPGYMKTDAVRPYYDVLRKKWVSLVVKRIFDLIVSIFMLIVLAPVIIYLSVAIVRDSKGGVFFRQERVTQYGRKFRIHKFRTMVNNSESIGSQLTVENDMRVTKIGVTLRKYRLDEIPQLIDVFLGDMSFVGTRPEVTKYVKKYTPEMMATLLLPAGVTSEASIKYRNEDKLLGSAEDVDDVYVNQVLVEKMRYNLRNIKNFDFFNEIKTMLSTVFAVIKKDDGIKATKEFVDMQK